MLTGSFGRPRGIAARALALGLAGLLYATCGCAAAPSVAYGTYFGGSGAETGSAVAVDSHGNILIAGTTTSTDLPGTAGSYQPIHAVGFANNTDVFVAKLDPSGRTLLWATYLGGDVNETVIGIAVGPLDSVYLVGNTSSDTFPFTSRLPGSGSPAAAFAAELSSDGKRLIYATALPISPTCMAVNPSGEVYLAGGSGSASATTGTLNAPGGAALLKLNPAGSAAEFVALLGAGSPSSIALDSQSNIYVAGSTGGNVLTTASSLEPTYPNSGLQSAGYAVGNGFVQKINSSGTQLIYGTYFGPRYADTTIASMTLGQDGTVYFGGTTTANSITATAGAFQTSPGPGYVASLNTAGTAMGAFSYLPQYSLIALTVGEGNILHCLLEVPPPDYRDYLALSAPSLSLVAEVPTIDCYQLALDPSNDLWIVGIGTSIDMSQRFVTNNAFQLKPKGATNAFLIEMTPANALSITAVTLAAGTVGAPYSQSLSATGGAPPYNWSIAAGSLPGGLNLSGSGVISGTPNTGGTSSFTVKVADSASSSVTQSFSITIISLVPVPVSLSVLSGNNQSGVVGALLGLKLVVKVLGSDGNPYAGATINFAVTSGTATVNPTSATTASDGTAATSVTLTTPGPIQVTASVKGLPSVVFSATALVVVPQIPVGGVMSAGLSSPPVQAVSPNAIISIFGQNFAPPGTNARVLPPDLVNGILPTSFAGVCVLFGNQRAPIFTVAPGQVNVQAPQALGPSTVTVQVIANCDTPSQSASNQVTVPTQASAPEFFYAAQNTSGSNPVAAVDGLTYGGIGDPARLGAGFALAFPGETVVIYGTGFGQTSPPVTTGALASGPAQVAGVTVNIDGSPLDPSAVQYAGVVPGSAGLYQLNIVLPPGLTPGDHTVVMGANGASSPSLAYISVGPN